LVRPTPVDEAFLPALEVDRFRWPNVCDALLEQSGAHLDDVARRLLAAAAAGQRVVAIGSCQRGMGCTTTLLCFARQLANQARTVAMVDADFRHPDLAARLGVAVTVGWDDVLRDERPLAEALVRSGQDRLALLPLRGTTPDGSVLAGNLPSSTSLRVLRQHFDLVLLDLGPVLENTAVAAGRPDAERAGVDAAVLVHNPQTTARGDLHHVAEALERVGVPAIGIAETFTAAA
ncbi:MAG: hypothetical protein A2W31_16095, partial [Planctomycetes bacterium RBG_16_64_10]